MPFPKSASHVDLGNGIGLVLEYILRLILLDKHTRFVEHFEHTIYLGMYLGTTKQKKCPISLEKVDEHCLM